MPRLLVRRPSPALASGELTHLERSPVDAALALSQWEQYVALFRSRGWEIVEAPPSDVHPDGVFVEDAIVVFDDLAVECRMGAATRRGESASAAEGLGLPTVPITPPGTLDGGDILKIGRDVYVGQSTRTNIGAFIQLRALLRSRGWTAHRVPVSRTLHLKSAVTALPDGTVIGYPPLVDDPGLFPSFLAVPEPEGNAVVVLDETTVLLSASAPLTAELLRERGLTVATTPVTEFEKLEGCVTCLSVRLR